MTGRGCRWAIISVVRYGDFGRFAVPLTTLALYLIIIMTIRPRGVVLVLWLAGLAVLVASIVIGVIGLYQLPSG